MIKFKCMPAIEIKILCEYCESVNLLLPIEFKCFKYLSDEELIGFNIITKLLSFIEKNITSTFFFVDFVPFFNQRIVDFIRIDLSSNTSDASKLIAFTQFYNQMSDLNWTNIETDDSVGLIAKRPAQSLASKYDDLIIYVYMMYVLKFSDSTKSNIIIEFPYPRSFYSHNAAPLKRVKFNCQSLSVFVKKDERDKDKVLVNALLPLKTSNLERINAAVNSIPLTDLNLTALANILGISPRSLQRKVKYEGCCVKDIIKKFKANAIISILNKNNGNIKVTAYECGFNNLSAFSRQFYNTVGCCPTEYVKRQNII
ncbi:AraC family transcriptional regulator [Shewanella sp. 10N.7]|uniref:helix-turn-helix domain-containing protein n=1 Tax=Shewanella sp. 10N.7 TaxID=2885093 RepID=UPI001E3F8F3E|nr:AraC family transcriptional regulator [Shewanella sp. 10N.7]MCC4833812.1 AraC family transcriptional regulator [Shewanella sp. 10N.7]